MKTFGKTIVAGKEIPIIQGRSIGYFSAGQHGEKEHGNYCFWSIAYLKPTGAIGFIRGRALEHLDAGERFRRIGVERKKAPSKDDRKEYSRLWRLLKTPLYIRPATTLEIADWLTTHPYDAPFLETLKVNVP